MARLGYVGLGIMGGPMARHLATAKHSMTVYNRTTAKADAWVEQNGGARALTPREVAQASDVVLMCVGNDDDVCDGGLSSGVSAVRAGLRFRVQGSGFRQD